MLTDEKDANFNNGLFYCPDSDNHKNTDNMKVIAQTIDGMNFSESIEVTAISVWIGRSCNHTVNTLSLLALIEQANKSGKMSIYNSGEIDAYCGTPLYTNGQKTVNRLIIDGRQVWKR